MFNGDFQKIILLKIFEIPNYSIETFNYKQVVKNFQLIFCVHAQKKQTRLMLLELRES